MNIYYGKLTPNVDSWSLRVGLLMPLRWALRSVKENDENKLLA